MTINKKMSGSERLTYILDQLQTATSPITGSTFAKETNVSRQVIVQDVSILKAKNEPIIATSQGYIYMKQEAKSKEKRTIICKHMPKDTRKELLAIVDHGVKVYDVRVEHPVYGDLTGIVNVSNRQEVEQFVTKLDETNATLLSELTEGIHLHTLEADSISQIDAACKELKKIGILFEG